MSKTVRGTTSSVESGLELPRSNAAPVSSPAQRSPFQSAVDQQAFLKRQLFRQALERQANQSRSSRQEFERRSASFQDQARRNGLTAGHEASFQRQAARDKLRDAAREAQADTAKPQSDDKHASPFLQTLRAPIFRLFQRDSDQRGGGGGQQQSGQQQQQNGSGQGRGQGGRQQDSRDAFIAGDSDAFFERLESGDFTGIVVDPAGRSAAPADAAQIAVPPGLARGVVYRTERALRGESVLSVGRSEEDVEAERAFRAEQDRLVAVQGSLGRARNRAFPDYPENDPEWARLIPPRATAPGTMAAELQSQQTFRSAIRAEIIQQYQRAAARLRIFPRLPESDVEWRAMATTGRQKWSDFSTYSTVLFRAMMALQWKRYTAPAFGRANGGGVLAANQ